MGTGLARGALARGKRIAFGDGRKIIWDVHSRHIFLGNPNVAPPGSEPSSKIEWIRFHRGHRIYNKLGNGRWIWNYDFKPTPGEIFLSKEERKFAEMVGSGHVVIEPNVPIQKSVAPNKQWPVERYEDVARQLRGEGFEVMQLLHGGRHRLKNVRHVTTASFRQALAILGRAALYIGPEGGMHHGAAAMGTRAVVLFGGFIPPQVTGYDTHTNLTGGAAEACGSLSPCKHCRAALEAISVDDVMAPAQAYLGKAAA